MESELGDCGEITIKGVIVGGIHGIMALFMRKGGRSLLVDISLSGAAREFVGLYKKARHLHILSRVPRA